MAGVAVEVRRPHPLHAGDDDEGADVMERNKGQVAKNPRLALPFAQSSCPYKASTETPITFSGVRSTKILKDTLEISCGDRQLPQIANISNIRLFHDCFLLFFLFVVVPSLTGLKLGSDHVHNMTRALQRRGCSAAESSTKVMREVRSIIC